MKPRTTTSDAKSSRTPPGGGYSCDIAHDVGHDPRHDPGPGDSKGPTIPDAQRQQLYRSIARGNALADAEQDADRRRRGHNETRD